MDEFVKRSNEIKTERQRDVEKISEADHEKIYSLWNWMNKETYNRFDQLNLEPEIKADLILIFQDHKYVERILFDGLLLKAEKGENKESE